MSDKIGDKIRLQHILDAINEIEAFTDGVNHEEFLESSMIVSASIRQLEIIGEASNRLSNNLINKHNQVNWSQIIGLRNILIHQYFGVDDEVVWGIIEQDLPELKEEIKKIIAELS